MWLSDRRSFLVAALALGGCGFTPVYGPAGAGQALENAVDLGAPKSDDAYLVQRRFEERLGRGSAYRLEFDVTTKDVGLGGTSTGNTTRYRVDGALSYKLLQGKAVLLQGKTQAFTGYSTTGSTLSTLAAEKDARKRLMVILADQLMDELILGLPAAS
jgi:LPS-assembly lipoprotein